MTGVHFNLRMSRPVPRDGTVNERQTSRFASLMNLFIDRLFGFADIEKNICYRPGNRRTIIWDVAGHRAEYARVIRVIRSDLQETFTVGIGRRVARTIDGNRRVVL